LFDKVCFAERWISSGVGTALTPKQKKKMVIDPRNNAFGKFLG
jgi:hypothetical protein